VSNLFVLSTGIGDGGDLYANLSVSLCCSALWTTRVEVVINSKQNRTEPVPVSNGNSEYRIAPDVHAEIGEYKNQHT
jgi:hypothetical protein